MHMIKPIDREAVVSAAKTGRIVCAQDGNIIGGLGYQVAAVLAEEGGSDASSRCSARRMSSCRSRRPISCSIATNMTQRAWQRI